MALVNALKNLKERLAYPIDYAYVASQRLAGMSLRESLQLFPSRIKLKQVLSRDAAILEFLPRNGVVLCTLFSPAIVKAVKLTLDSAILNSLRRDAALLDPSMLTKPEALGAAQRLKREGYRYLIAPLEELFQKAKIYKVAIVPNGELARIPFHIMVDESERPIRDRLEISYLPSLMTVNVLQPRRTASPNITVLADPQDNLPIARAVCLTLDQLGAKVIVGSEVDHNTFIACLQESGHLLICCHADESGLRLSDGIFSAEMLHRQLDNSPCSSVALIACKAGNLAASPTFVETAGEGLPGVLLGKGTGPVIASRWRIPELSATVFSEYWVRMLTSGESPVEAYRVASSTVEKFSVNQLLDWFQGHSGASEVVNDQASSLWFRTAVALEIKKLVELDLSLPPSLRYSLLRLSRETLNETYPLLAWGHYLEDIPLIDVKDAKTEIELEVSRLAERVESDSSQVDDLSLPVFTAPIHSAAYCLFSLPN